jgi:hypothetical protein
MKDLVTLSARAVALLWAAFWLCFFIAESLFTGTRLHEAIPWLVLGLVFLVVALIPWRWEVAGGYLLVGAALAVGIAYAIFAPRHLAGNIKLHTAILFSIPPLLAGFLFLTHRRLTPDQT